MKYYPNVRVSPKTFEILNHLKKVRDDTYDTVIRDMLYEFAPDLMRTVDTWGDDPEWTSFLEKDDPNCCHDLAEEAYASYWYRVKKEVEVITEDGYLDDKRQIKKLDKLRKELT